MGIFIKKIFIFSFLILWCTPASVFASDIFFESNNQSFVQGEEFLVNVFLNTEKESVNAVEGEITFPADLLEVKKIRDGNSIINFWIQKPIEEQGEIIFSGITPGGFSGQKNFLFSVVFNAKKNGNGSINFNEIKVLLNDGKGTSASLKISNFQFSIRLPDKQVSKETSFVTTAEIIKDIEMPEDFRPTIANDPNIFDGRYFLVFATQDKSSGIDHYEVCEGRWNWFTTAESPYLLKYQSLNKKIFVKAVDKAGNERVAMLEAQNYTPWYQHYFIIFGIILILIVFGFLLKKKWLKYIK